MQFLSSARRWLTGAARSAPSPAAKQPAFASKLPRGPTSLDMFRAAIAAARELPDGTPVDDLLMAALHTEIDARRMAAAMVDGPPSPQVSGLRIRKTNLPDWWEASGSLMLQAPDTPDVEVAHGLMGLPVTNAVVVVGAGGTPPRFALIGADPLVVIGDCITMFAASMTVAHESMVLIGERTTATWMCSADVRNGGVLIAGPDCMWASGINFLTDDTHAIREAATGKRINRRGGRIMLEEHVWISDHVRIMGDTRVGSHGIIGATSFVKNITLPPHTVSIGRPARPARSGVTWTRDDGP